MEYEASPEAEIIYLDERARDPARLEDRLSRMSQGELELYVQQVDERIQGHIDAATELRRLRFSLQNRINRGMGE